MVRAVVDKGLSKAQAARQFNTTWKTVDKWVTRFRALGVEGLRDRSSRPHSSPSQTPLATAEAVEALRRDRHTQCHVAAQLGLSTATVSRICKARGLSRLTAIEPKQPRPRYEREAPGELVHLDIKKLGRFWKTGFRITGRITGHRRSDGAGYEFAHVAIDDHSRIARIDIMPDEKKESAVLCLERTVAYFQSIGVRIDRVMTDNGSCYRSRAFAKACATSPSNTSPPGPTPHRPTARPSASSRPRCASGPTLPPSKPQSSAKPSSQSGSIATTGIDPMLASQKCRPSAASVSIGTTSCNFTANPTYTYAGVKYPSPWRRRRGPG